MAVEYVFYGAGAYCEEYVKAVLASRIIDLSFIVDSNKNKIGRKIFGIPVRSAEDLKAGKHFVIVTVADVLYPEISECLNRRGLVEGKDFLHCREFFPLSLTSRGISSGLRNIPGCELPVRKSFDRYYSFIDGKAGKAYRSIPQDHAESAEKIFKILRLNNVMPEYFLEMQVSDKYVSEQFPLVFEQNLFDYDVSAWELSPSQFKEYTIFLLDFLAELCKLDVTIGDLSPGNFTILDGQFKYFDFGSLSFSKINMNNMIKCWSLYINILHLFSKSQTKKAYMYLFCDCTKEASPNKNDILLYLNDSEKSRYETTYDNSLTLISTEPMKVLSDLREYVVSIDVECKANSFWRDAQKACFASGVGNRDEMFLKYKVALDFIEKARPRTFIDLAGNSAYLAIAAKDLFEYGVSADYDIDASDNAWGNVKKYNAANVIPVVFNFMCPTPPRHNSLVSFGKSVIPTNRDGFTRYKSDCAVCLSVIHHLIFQQLYTFPEIIGALAQYTNKWLIVEYIDRNCFSVKNYLQKFDWYTKKTFENELSELFDIVEARITLFANDDNQPTRYTYLCIKKEL